jgi:hypothetical protein
LEAAARILLYSATIVGMLKRALDCLRSTLYVVLSLPNELHVQRGIFLCGRGIEAGAEYATSGRGFIEGTRADITSFSRTEFLPIQLLF